MTDLEDLPLAVPHSPFPGLVVERRGFFGTVAAAFAAVSFPGARSNWSCRVGGDDWTLLQFVTEVTPVCKDLLADLSARGQDRYLLTLASYAVRLGAVPVPESRQIAPGYRLGSDHGPDPFTVLHWQLEPKATIGLHAHTYGNVVTLGLEGEALISNYEQVGPRTFATDADVSVVRVEEQVLRRGDVNLVSLERHYVHGFVAGPAGASGLDITTRIRPREKTPTLEVRSAVDAEARTFKARWHMKD